MKYTSTSSMSLTQINIKAYGKFLEETPWTFYCTLSTKYPLTTKSARIKMNKLQSFLKEQQSLDNSIFWIAEPFDSRFGYHIHALIKIHNSNPLKYDKQVNKAWQNVTKGSGSKFYNRTIILPYIIGKGANFYLTKFLGRDDIDYDFI